MYPADERGSLRRSKPHAQAALPRLTISIDCMGASSLVEQGQAMGLQLGYGDRLHVTTWFDDNCAGARPEAPNRRLPDLNKPWQSLRHVTQRRIVLSRLFWQFLRWARVV